MVYYKREKNHVLAELAYFEIEHHLTMQKSTNLWHAKNSIHFMYFLVKKEKTQKCLGTYT